MTSELREAQGASASPERIRISVLGGRTQLDVALPADVPVAALLPELVRLIGSRDTRDGEGGADREERRTFWVLTRVGDGTALAPDDTLRSVGIGNGELLRVASRPTLSPPTLHDDVVDAAARLNRAAYAPWNASAAGVMAIVGLWMCTAVWVYFLGADALSAHRGAVVGGALLTTVLTITSGALANRYLGRGDIATAAGWPAIALSAAIGWVLAARYGDWGLAAACVVLLVLTVAYHRLVGTGHWTYLTAAVVFGFGAITLLGRALGAPVQVLSVAAATVATLTCLSVPTLTARLGRFPTPTVRPGVAHKDRPFDDRLAAVRDEADSGAAMPSAEDVWARVRSAALSRAGLLAGLATVVVVSAVVLVRTEIGWPSFSFALVCAAVLAVRNRCGRIPAERAALAAPAVALALATCVQVQAGHGLLPLAGIGVLVALAVLAMVAGVVAADGVRPVWVSTATAYADYVLTAALIPLAFWALGIYDRLGPW
ncbi:type VII secretion integral membrane protein EccD [Mycobacterium sp. LTG2003]